MKLTRLFLGSALLAALVAPPALAADGEITFVGKIIAETCEIDGNGEGAPNFTVALPTVAVNAFGRVGDTAGQMPFYIQLSGASCADGGAAMHFEADNADLVTGDLKNIAIAGSNVQVRITDSTNRQINVGNNSGAPWFDIVDGKARLDYRAHYVATTDQAAAGEVRTVARYTIAYR